MAQTIIILETNEAEFDCFEKMISNLNLLSPRNFYFKNIFKNFFIIN